MSEKLQHKLFHFTETPPERSWNALSEALDEQSRPYVQRLSNYAETPGKQNWEKITDGLVTPVKQPELVAPARFRLPVKMMVAAAILAVLAFGIIRVINFRPLTSNSRAERAHPLPSRANAEAAQDPTLQGLNAPEKDRKLNRTLSEEAASETARVTREVRLRPSRYVTINNEDGKQVRLSKKAYTLMACAENSTAINYNRCKETIQLVQQKMSASLFSPSGDFSGLVDMVRSLEEQN